MAKVFLDALIPRADFEEKSMNTIQPTFNDLPIVQLTNPLFYPFLRKPDFQRETNEWDAKKINDILDSFISSDLIPSIILWKSTGYIFVIDGAHRLSALLAWIHNDYGDGDISMKYFNNYINDEQRKIAEETRKLINKKIGSYQSIVNHSNTDNIEIVQKAQSIGVNSLTIQWVKGDAKQAENSFFKINQQGVPLNNTEKKLLENRNKGNCIAARAIKTGGTGHKYWSDYSANTQNEIQMLSEDINKSLFTPPLIGPVKSLDLPIAGKISSPQAIPLILDFVNIVNKIPIDKNILSDDITGNETLKYLKNVRKIIWRINSTHMSSLGLHPLVYFYSLEGKHKSASFYAIAEFIVKLEKADKFNDFIKIRKFFEDFLLKYHYLSQQINDKYKYATKSFKHISNMYIQLINILQNEINIDKAAKALCSDKNFNYLTLHQEISENDSVSSDFKDDTKSAVFIKEALNNPIRCRICNGLIHRNSITIDHIIRKRDGGLGEVDNGQLAHPYCNSTYKN